MPHEVNDWVVHLHHGIGRVVKVEARHFGPGTARRYYEIAIAKGTIWVPVDGPARGLRKLTSKRDLAKYRALLSSRPVAFTGDRRERQIALAERLKEGSFKARCELVRDLTALGWEKPLSESSGVLLRSAHEVLCAEWAATEGLSVVEATQEVESLLQEGRNTFMK